MKELSHVAIHVLSISGPLQNVTHPPPIMDGELQPVELVQPRQGRLVPVDIPQRPDRVLPAEVPLDAQSRDGLVRAEDGDKVPVALVEQCRHGLVPVDISLEDQRPDRVLPAEVPLDAQRQDGLFPAEDSNFPLANNKRCHPDNNIYQADGVAKKTTPDKNLHQRKPGERPPPLKVTSLSHRF